MDQISKYQADLNIALEENRKLVNELKRFKIAAEQSIEMMVFTDKEGIVFWTNKATERITGFTVEETVGRKVGVLWGKLMTKEWYANLWDTIKNKKRMFISEIENHRKNGEHFWSTITIYPLLDKDDNIEFFISTQRDITHEREVDRMKTDFISMASHQLRTPLTAMKWLLEILSSGDLGVVNAKQQEALSDIDRSNNRMIELVNGLLNISRIESGRMMIEPKPTNLVSLIDEVKNELIVDYKNKEQSINIKSDLNLTDIMIDPNLVREVITNLLTNANKYTPSGGKIDISLSSNDEGVIISVSDNGYGIPKMEQSKIFNRFYRGSNIIKLETGGTGLGLYLSKIIVETCGGKIWIESTEGKGTNVSFTIPKSGMKAKKGEVSITT